MKLSVIEITVALEANKIEILSSKEVQDGVQLKVSGGTITAYKTGTVVVQGEKKKYLEDVLNGKAQNGDAGMFSSFGQTAFNDATEAKVSGESPAVHATAPQPAPAVHKNVFIVHGHDRSTLLELQNFLYRNGYNPIVLGEQTDGGDTIIEKLERMFERNDIAAAIVIATPDDIYEHPKPNMQYTQVARCRPNVELELGFVIAHLTRRKLVYLRKSVLENVEFILPSDVSGVVYQQFSQFNQVEFKILNELAFITSTLV